MPEAKKAVLSKKLLLSFYAIIPLSLLLVFVDLAFFDGAIRDALPYSPYSLLVILVFFNLPHIVGSSLILFDKEYVAYYKKRILISIPIIIVSLIIVPQIIGRTAFHLLFAAWTVKHVVNQQLGLSIMMVRMKDQKLWRWLGLIIAVMLYFGVLVPGMEFHGTQTRPYMEVFMLALLVPFTFITLKMGKASPDAIGRYYVWGNGTMMITTYFLYVLDYAFFVVLIPRVIHDLTAFAFYMVHDQNRNCGTAHNMLYRPFRRLGLPVMYLTPIYAIALAWPVTYYAYLSDDHHVGMAFAVAISMFHYYTESFTWKNGTPHRQAIAIA